MGWTGQQVSGRSTLSQVSWSTAGWSPGGPGGRLHPGGGRASWGVGGIITLPWELSNVPCSELMPDTGTTLMTFACLNSDFEFKISCAPLILIRTPSLICLLMALWKLPETFTLNFAVWPLCWLAQCFAMALSIFCLCISFLCWIILQYTERLVSPWYSALIPTLLQSSQV